MKRKSHTILKMKVTRKKIALSTTHYNRASLVIKVQKSLKKRKRERIKIPLKLKEIIKREFRVLRKHGDPIKRNWKITYKIQVFKTNRLEIPALMVRQTRLNKWKIYCQIILQ